MIYKIYTDGSTRKNGDLNAIGAYGFVILNEDEQIIGEESKIEECTTNQRVELLAAINSIKFINHLINNNDFIEIYTDSAYLCNCKHQNWYKNWLKNGWINSKKQPVANKDLWEQLIPIFENKQIDFIKVKGHAGRNYHEMWNEYVDNLVQTASSKRTEVNNGKNCNN